MQVTLPANNAYTGTHNDGQDSQTSKMPTHAVNPTALAYSVMNAYQHGEVKRLLMGILTCTMPNKAISLLTHRTHSSRHPTKWLPQEDHGDALT